VVRALGIAAVAWGGLAAYGRAEAGGAVGLMVDAGVPEGLGASLVYRPHGLLRLHVGGGHNLAAGPGVNAGLSLRLVDWVIAPSLNVSGGRYFEANANGTVGMLVGDPQLDSPVLREVGYYYTSGHVGLEFGAETVTVFLHAGMSVVRARIHNLEAVVAAANDSDATISISEDPRVVVAGPTARAGLIFYF
jgi:hypothetical protein